MLEKDNGDLCGDSRLMDMASNSKYQPEVIQRKIFAMQVCVPSDFTDEDVVLFAEKNNPSAVFCTYKIAREGDKFLMGTPERALCEVKQGFVHIVLMLC